MNIQPVNGVCALHNPFSSFEVCPSGIDTKNKDTLREDVLNVFTLAVFCEILFSTEKLDQRCRGDNTCREKELDKGRECTRKVDEEVERVRAIIKNEQGNRASFNKHHNRGVGRPSRSTAGRRVFLPPQRRSTMAKVKV